MKTRTIILLLIALMMSFGYYKFQQWHQQEGIRAAPEYGRLASLPDTATDVQVDTEGSMFSHTFWLCFKADKTTINKNKWVTQSSSLSKKTPVAPPAVNSLVGEVPNWFNPQIISQEIRFDIPSNEEALYGTVWIDYASGTVYIKTSHS